MKFSLLLFFITLFSFSVSGQSDKIKKELYKNNHAIDSVYFLSLKLKNIGPINRLIQSKKIILNETKTNLLCVKAIAMESIYFFKDDATEEDIKEQSGIILNLYDSILTQSECLSQPKVKNYRYRFLSRLVLQYNRKLNKELTSLYRLTKSELKSIGLKPERDGFGLGIHSIHGKENWLGVDFSIVSYYHRVSYLKYNCINESKFYRPSKRAVQSVNALTFSYSKSFKSKTNDLSFSLLEMNAPLTFIPFRFGVQTQPGSSSKRFYYRPGLGLSIGMVSLSYSYNLMFSKSIRASSEKHLLNFRVIYPIVNFRYRTKRY